MTSKNSLLCQISKFGPVFEEFWDQDHDGAPQGPHPLWNIWDYQSDIKRDSLVQLLLGDDFEPGQKKQKCAQSDGNQASESFWGQLEDDRGLSLKEKPLKPIVQQQKANRPKQIEKQ